ncbi:MAG: cache domain-containing protein [Candidatus Cloacimonetes bacterium]|nr:cache domain-containing protein [Candidatus Cloacimonadota bacterium]
MNKIKYQVHIFFSMIILFPILFTSGCKHKYDNLDLSKYQYRDTKDLIKFVYDAVLIMEKDGMKSLEYFRNNRDIYKTKDYYLYIYEMDGTNIYHAGMEHLEGKNLFDIKDKNGKKIVPLVLKALEDKNNSHSWVHFSWWEPGKFYPVPKSSCHFQVKTPEGKVFFVGGGLNYPQEEKEFIRIIVDNATQLIEKKGQEAFTEISDPVSQYNYRDVRVFAFREDGKILISPVIDDSLWQIQLLKCSDEVGHKPFIKALEELESIDRVWEVFMAKNKYQRVLVKKCLYIRKTIFEEEKIFVGAITDLPQPP